ncbi:hypothetical protein TELCIR_15357 [Teladorsagia circumcincta]|uniref:Uncharacterized protein n=1 Tax=Teladorsagia circumcincta TaxID=45464 RepID=A0A2G9TYG4_TELCI|nr:hypothetical protein TELCIR_15357 [Teladorsagia circumcincta]
MLPKCSNKDHGQPSKKGICDWKALRYALPAQDGCLHSGHRIVIPESLRGTVLKQLHKGHPGMKIEKFSLEDMSIG